MQILLFLKTITIITKVKGRCPVLILAKELKSININTIPLAPNKPKPKRKMLKKPVMHAVINIIISIVLEPCFSSNNGPINNIRVRLPKDVPNWHVLIHV